MIKHHRDPTAVSRSIDRVCISSQIVAYHRFVAPTEAINAAVRAGRTDELSALSLLSGARNSPSIADTRLCKRIFGRSIVLETAVTPTLACDIMRALGTPQANINPIQFHSGIDQHGAPTRVTLCSALGVCPSLPIHSSPSRLQIAKNAAVDATPAMSRRDARPRCSLRYSISSASCPHMDTLPAPGCAQSRPRACARRLGARRGGWLLAMLSCGAPGC
ncbi:hypothetical protein DENSPDRAFT_325646 [Dentipellis sp. KUC8613]|nr:hypothetical protein DENSPDRAFT_325646 [Dentipellis sp. KUC8613]